MQATGKIFKSCLFTMLLILITAAGGLAQSGAPVPDTGIVPRAEGHQTPSKVNGFTIQVAAYRSLTEVERDFSRLVEKGCNPFCRYEEVAGKGKWYRVYVGSYATKTAARDAAEKLVQRNVVDDYIIRRLDAGGEYVFSSDLDDSGKKMAAEASPTGRAAKDADAPPAAAQPVPSPQVIAQAAPTPNVQPEPAADMRTDDRDVRLSLLDAIRFGLEGNRDIGVVSYAPKQAQEDLKGAEAVYDPLLFSDTSFRRDPNLESSVSNIVTEDNAVSRTGVRKPLGTGGSLSGYLETRYGDLNNAQIDRVYKHLVAPTIELRQPLLNNLGGKKEKTAIKIAGFQENISNEEFRQKVIETANSIAKIYWKLYMFRELIEVNRQNLDMAEEIHRRETERLNRGISQQLDVERARSNVQSRRSTLLKSEEEYRVTMDQLKLLLNWKQLRIDSDVDVVPVQTPQTAPMNVDEMEAIEAALKYRPEMIKARQELRIREADVELAANQRLPKLDAFGRYGVSGYGEDFGKAVDDVSFDQDNVWEVGLNFEWAIGNRSVNSQYRKKKLRRVQAKEQIERLEDDITLDVKQVLKRIATSRGDIEATRLAREAAKKVVEGEFVRFDIGQTGNLELLRAQDLLAVTSRSYLRAVTDYNIALHELQRARGALPDGVTIEEANR